MRDLRVQIPHFFNPQTFNMIRKTILIIPGLILCIFLYSCEKEIELKIDESGKMLVVNSIICPDSLVTVSVSYSQYIFGNQPTTYVANAKVLLFEEEKLLDTLVWKGKGKYQSKHRPQTDKNYRLEVSDESQTAIAKCKVPEMVLIESLSSETIMAEFMRPATEITILFKDNVGQKNSYKLILKGMRLSDTWPDRYYRIEPLLFEYNKDALDEQTNALDELNDYINCAGCSKGGRRDLVFSDKSFDGTSREIVLNLWGLALEGYPVYIHLQTLSEDYYNYLYTLDKNKAKGAFYEPIAIHSNIENGLGIFAAYNNVVDSLMF